MRPIKKSPLTLDAIRAVLSVVCASRNIERVELFGSWARGDNHPDSDVDLLVEFSADSNPGLLELGDLKEDLEERFGCRVDVLTHRGVEHGRNPIRRKAIFSETIPVYAQ